LTQFQPCAAVLPSTPVQLVFTGAIITTSITVTKCQPFRYRCRQGQFGFTDDRDNADKASSLCQTESPEPVELFQCMSTDSIKGTSVGFIRKRELDSELHKTLIVSATIHAEEPSPALSSSGETHDSAKLIITAHRRSCRDSAVYYSVLVGHPSYSTIPKHVRSPNRSPDRRSWCPSLFNQALSITLPSAMVTWG
jgi:hypothetical protein